MYLEKAFEETAHSGKGFTLFTRGWCLLQGKSINRFLFNLIVLCQKFRWFMPIRNQFPLTYFLANEINANTSSNFHIDYSGKNPPNKQNFQIFMDFQDFQCSTLSYTTLIITVIAPIIQR